MSFDAVLVRFAELGLKGANRPLFERALRQNLKKALRPWSNFELLPVRGRLLVLAEHPERILQPLTKVCGVKTISPTWRVESKLDAMAEQVRQVFRRARESGANTATFRVTTRRAEKRFPLRSNDVNRELGAAVLHEFPDTRVQLEHPDLEIGVEIRTEGTFVFAEKIPGPGGLPVGTTGRALGLLSGGIDSPVACALAMKRGLWLSLAFFHSPEFTGEGPREKVLRLAKILAPYQPHTRLFVVPFGPTQVGIKEHCAEEYRTLLYRRIMHRIAEKLAASVHAKALVTGDSLGQVASQTLENLQVTAAATHLPILRPLLTFDKEETILLAQQLGTYETSVLREPDCCTLFQPARPKIRGSLVGAAAQEHSLPLSDWVDQCLSHTERIDLLPNGRVKEQPMVD